MEKELTKNGICSSMAGVKLLHYVDVKNVINQTPSGDGWNVTLKSGHYWRRIHFSTAKVHTESEGECYRHTVEVSIPGKNAIAARDLMALERGKYLVRVVDNNGSRWLIGDIETSLTLKVQDNNDGTAVGSTAFDLVFSGLTQWPQMPIV